MPLWPRRIHKIKIMVPRCAIKFLEKDLLLFRSVMTTSTEEEPLWKWTISTAMPFIYFIISVYIFCRERRKRQNPDCLIPSKYLAIFSYLCIVMGPTVTFLSVLEYLPTFCVVNDFFCPLTYLQYVAMECYQLCRLYYCFSRKQIHSEVGYPNCIFITLLSVLIIWLVGGVATCYSWFKTQCRIQSDGSVVSAGIALFPGGRPWFLEYALNCIYGAVEITTVSLYWYKVHSLRKYQNTQDRAVYDRIQCILHRVLILTFFYLVIATLLTIMSGLTATAVNIGLISDSPFGLWTGSIMILSISYSMFLMQDHNTSEYIVFLQFIKQYKCIWCFCCFGSMVNEQYRMLVDNVDERNVRKMISAPTMKDNTSTLYKNNTTGMELSVATRTEIEVHSDAE